MSSPQIALLSAYHKDDRLRDFAKSLIGLGWKLLASSGTKKFLDQNDVPSTDIADLVGPPILGHRVVTLDRKVYAAILARADNPDDMAELKRIGVEPISLVYVDLYPLEEELRSENCTIASILEKTDIGGPTLLRAAAKGRLYVVSNPNQFENVLNFMRSPGDPNPFRAHKFVNGFFSHLALAAEETVARYAELSAEFHRSVADGDFPRALRRKAL
jgi:phosphoribosylaminoimidazolecarboxamide formyltransferase/IMP cyclohydrolase